MPRSNQIFSECRICGAPAHYSYYGAVACESCKVFFRRNAKDQKKVLQCRFGGECDVNTLNRHLCSACRLHKCFDVGMCADLIRCPQTKKKKKNQDSISTSSISLIRRTDQHPQELRTLNLLERDHSTLTIDEWTLLSNLIHSYDEHNGLAAAKNFAKEISHLHPKLRLKLEPNRVIEIMTILGQTTEPFIRSNQHFAALPANDRMMILRSMIENVSCLGCPFILRVSELIEDSAFRNGLELTYGTVPYNLSLTLTSSLNEDVDLIKLMLAIFAFSTGSCTLFDENNSWQFSTGMKSVLDIQYLYVELLWKYLVYKYTFEQAVIRFSHLVQSMITTVTVRAHLQVVKNHTDVMELLAEKIEHQQIDSDPN